MTPAVHGRGAAPTRPPRALGDCIECGKPFGDREHRGVQTHLYRRADGFTAAVNTPPRPSVDEMATQMLTDTANQTRVPVQELAVAVGQMMGVGALDVGTSMTKLAKAQRRATGVLIEEQFERPRDPNYSEPGRRHRTFPWAWWLRRCKCRECTRRVDHAHIEAMERGCRIRDTTTGELVWPDPKVGDRDRHGRTVVQIGPDGEVVWDRMAPPAPPARDPGRAQWV